MSVFRGFHRFQMEVLRIQRLRDFLENVPSSWGNWALKDWLIKYFWWQCKDFLRMYVSFDCNNFWNWWFIILVEGHWKHFQYNPCKKCTSLLKVTYYYTKSYITNILHISKKSQRTFQQSWTFSLLFFGQVSTLIWSKIFWYLHFRLGGFWCSKRLVNASIVETPRKVGHHPHKKWNFSSYTSLSLM